MNNGTRPDPTPQHHETDPANRSQPRSGARKDATDADVDRAVAHLTKELGRSFTVAAEPDGFHVDARSLVTLVLRGPAAYKERLRSL